VSALSYGYLCLRMRAAVAAAEFGGKQGGPTCSPCLPGLLNGARLSGSISSFNMKGFYKKAKQKAKGMVDSLRPPSR